MLITKLLNSPVVLGTINVLLALIIFLTNIICQSTIATNTLYVVTVMLSLWLPKTKHIIYFAIFCVFLTIVGNDWPHNNAWSLERLLNTAIIVFTIIVTTTFAIQRKIIVQALEKYEHKQFEEKLIWMSNHDELTEILNRRYFNKQIIVEWNRLVRTKVPLALIMIDVDNFKKYNDTLGHQEGDICLKTIATALNKTIHRVGDFVARYGGDEFVFLLPSTSSDGLVHIANKVQEAIHTLNIKLPYPGPKEKITVSLGLSAMIPALDSSVEVLINQADQALYQAKNSGKDCYKLYEG